LQLEQLYFLGVVSVSFLNILSKAGVINLPA